MDTITDVSEVQRSHGEFSGFRHLKRIDENNTTPEELKWLWDKIQTCDYAFDDYVRGKVDLFLTKFADDNVEFFKLGSSGIVTVEPAYCGMAVHYLVWDAQFDLMNKKAPVAELFDYLFFKRQAHHIIGMIPSNNQKAIRFALSSGLKFEGEIREAFLYKGNYFNVNIYGLLELEYRQRRGRLL